MKLGVVSGPRYSRVGEQYYTSTSYHADMWKECRGVFDEVIIADRVIHKDNVEAGQKPVLIDGVRFIEYPNFEGLWALVKTFPRMFWRARKAARQADVWHLHGPNFGSFCMWFWVWLYGIPYSLELRGEQSMNYTYLKLRGTRFPRLVSLIMRFLHNLQLTRPVAVVAVSKSLLQAFPPRNSCPTFAISDSRIPEELYGQERSWSDDSGCRTIICVGRCEAQKNPPGTMRALAKLDEKGFTSWKFVWVGGGDFDAKTQQLADELGLSDKVNLLGFVPWDEVFEILGTADLFLLNSVSEGMPRALMEGMARALPAIATDVGGVSELLHPEDIVPMLQDDVLADKLYEVLTDPDRLSKMSRRNLQTAKRYSASALSAKKVKFYGQLKDFASRPKK